MKQNAAELSASERATSADWSPLFAMRQAPRVFAEAFFCGWKR